MQQAWELAKKGVKAGPVVLAFGRPQRNTGQNRKLWPMLADVSEQVSWYGEKMTPEDWKDVLSASLKKQRAVPGIDGGFVVLGLRTSKLSKTEFADLIELIYAFGAQQCVAWSEPALKAYQDYKEAQV